MTVVQCYAATENANREEKEAFYDRLDRTLLDMHRNKSDIILLMRDFNAQVGNDNQDTEDVIGKYSYPTEMRMEIFLLSCVVGMDLLSEVPYFPIRIVIRLLGCHLLLKIRWKNKEFIYVSVKT
jgi:hypothetical protein